MKKSQIKLNIIKKIFFFVSQKLINDDLNFIEFNRGCSAPYQNNFERNRYILKSYKALIIIIIIIISLEQ